MPKVPVYNLEGNQVGEMDLADSIFDVEPQLPLLEEAVRTQMANRRRSIASTKDRSEVRGGGRKPWKQKGTGRARHGSIRSPLWSGGGITFGPNADRNWSLKMNRKAYRKALFMALTDKLQAEGLKVVEGIELSEPKTGILAKKLTDWSEKVGGNTRKMLLVTAGKNDVVERASRNLSDVSTIKADSLNVYDILNSNSVVVLKDAVQVIENTYSNSKE